MKPVRITTQMVGLVFRRGEYHRLLRAGLHWVRPTDQVKVYDRTQTFYPPVILDLLLKDDQLAKELHVVEVGDEQLAFKFVNGNFKKVLTPGRYAYWKGVIDYRFVMADLTKPEITEDLSPQVLTDPAVRLYVRTFVVMKHERGLLMVDGKLVRELGTGTYYFWRTPVSLEVPTTDTRRCTLEVPGQEILTSDKAALRINLQAQYRVVDIQKALMGNRDFLQQLYMRLQLSLREQVGALTFDQLLARKQQVGADMLKAIREKVDDLGVEVYQVGIRDIILPGDVKEIMNQVLVAEKKAQANLIMRREETASTRSLLNTAKLLDENPMLLRLKEMEYLERIADKVNTISLAGGGQVLEQLKTLFLQEGDDS
jgi:regulator of protease activity HflC (stomatin/prohibitin superfamily)